MINKVTIVLDDYETHANWYCQTCCETVRHDHKPKRPTYDELVSRLKEIERRVTPYYTFGGRPPAPWVNREDWVGLRNFLERVDKGR